MLKEGIKFVYINNIVAIYNNEDGASSSNSDIKFLNKKNTLIISSVGLLPYYNGLIVKVLNKCMASLKNNWLKLKNEVL